MNGKTLATSAFTLLLLLGSCASPSFNYEPQELSSPDKATRHAAIYPEPPAAPQGEVRIRSLGVVDLRPKGRRNRIPALHLRMTVANTNAPTVWSLDTGEQLISFSGRGPAHPTYANSDSAGLPRLSIETGARRSVDLYYALPAGASSAKELAEFDVKWSVQAGGNQYSGDTSFYRAVMSTPTPMYPEDSYPVGYGPYWWDTWGAEPVAPMPPPIRIRK